MPSVLPLFFIVSVSKDFKYLTQKHFIDTQPLNKIKKDALPVTQSIIENSSYASLHSETPSLLSRPFHSPLPANNNPACINST